LLWAATSFPRPASYRVDAETAAAALTGTAAVSAPLSQEDIASRRGAENLEYSIAGRIGHRLEFVFRPLGFDWKIVTAMIGAFAAKEIFVAQMGIVYSIADADKGSDGLRRVLARDYGPLVGLSLMLFLLVGTPCMATVAVTRRESGKWSYALLQLGGLTGIAYALSLLVYQIGKVLV
jgi:ferrous iron transport protein B